VETQDKLSAWQGGFRKRGDVTSNVLDWWQLLRTNLQTQRVIN